ncbi:MAG: hypothetical protein AVDCRST_MAG77-962 [uncultured Chloroflexi bacterium]|uniref:Uncharacterized protein n=1 Tax=uncultured Chloroflexota bacterium TaxID=166587 RepID=A0A6J4HN46_9CHLR|nr:MAG: hypothetical protein AVDCRST_MAG77-962 [uncultured Chloroflexota bacterium]
MVAGEGGAAERLPGEGTSRYLSVAQVARRLSCSVSLVQKWRRLGWLPATRLGPEEVPVYGYQIEDVERFAAERWNRRRGRPPGSGTRSRPAGVPVGHPTDGRAGTPFGAADVAPTVDSPTNEVAKAVDAPPLGAASVRAPSVDTLPAEVAPPFSATLPAEGASPATAVDTAPMPALPESGRPVVIWDADPRDGTAIVLARFGAREIQTALDTAESWARRYPDLAVGALASAASEPYLIAVWRGGRRLPG